jgi:hypothetical protein
VIELAAVFVSARVVGEEITGGVEARFMEAGTFAGVELGEIGEGAGEFHGVMVGGGGGKGKVSFGSFGWGVCFELPPWDELSMIPLCGRSGKRTLGDKASRRRKQWPL